MKIHAVAVFAVRRMQHAGDYDIDFEGLPQR